ncbi:MAG: hypothetical protein BAJALOKI1v1_840013 [Promethearchaeota archaeon]|nr:MAG: hypothetical protein BAJALOKI1v1_840013 [Candidatus Lokiarchaeota archaeon]
MIRNGINGISYDKRNTTTHIKSADKEKKEERDREQHKYIFQHIIKIIEDKKLYFLGPEKSKTARFIADHYQEILRIINVISTTEDENIIKCED